MLDTYLSNKMKTFKHQVCWMDSAKKRHYTYEEVDQKATQYAKAFLAMGLKSGDHMAILAPSSSEWLFTLLACIRTGIILVALNDGSSQKELGYCLNHSDAKALITTASGLEKLRETDTRLEVTDYVLRSENYPLIKRLITTEGLEAFVSHHEGGISEEVLQKVRQAVSGESSAMMQYSSGTTGNPKAILLQNDRIAQHIALVSERFKYTSEDKILLALPLYHVMGCILTVLVAMESGASLVLIQRFRTKEVLALIEKERCTAFHGVPTMYHFMLQECKNYDLTSMKTGMMGGSNCDLEAKKRFLKDLHISQLVNIYGQTEALAITQTDHEDAHENKLLTVGKVVDGLEAKIIDVQTRKEVGPGIEGELIVKSPFLMQGYYKNEAETKKTIQDGWLYTGDVATMDEQGYIVIKNRLKDIIIRGGENISPVEIEETLKTCDLIQDASVVGVKDQMLGEEVAATIILKGQDHFKFISDNTILKEALEEEIKKFVLKNLARHKKPRYIEFVDRFPTTASGKIQKYKLRERIEMTRKL